MSIAVSITMATYNVAPFLADSLDRILDQSFADIEIICIDDGSNDGSRDILLEYASKDKRIQLVLKEKNEGLAVARNQSLELAQGKYVAFLDGDDLIDTDLFQKAYEIAERDEADMVIWDYCTFIEPMEIEAKRSVTSRLADLDPADRIALLQLPAFTWIKLFRTDKLRKLKVHFPNGLTRQDIPVHWQLMTTLERISILPEILSYYRQQADATTHKKDQRLFDLAKVTDLALAYLIESGNYAEFSDEFLRQQLNLLYGMYDNVRDDLKPQALDLIGERLNADQVAYINSDRPMRKQARLFYQAHLGSRIAALKLSTWRSARSLYRTIRKR